jgi:hypothetical protein
LIIKVDRINIPRALNVEKRTNQIDEFMFWGDDNESFGA